MDLKRLRPMPVRPPTHPHIQCSAPIKDPAGAVGWRRQRYRQHGRDPMCCQMWAVALIEGKPYCSRHGGEIVLRAMLEQAEGADGGAASS